MNREITVNCIAQTRVNRDEMREWLRSVGAETFAADLPQTEQGWDERPIITDADLLVGTAGKRCYNSFEVGLNPNVTKIREDWTIYLDNILKSGHGSVLEHATWTWAFEGVTRVFTAEMNRHRAGVAISEASLRYIRFDSTAGIPHWEPLSIKSQPCPNLGSMGGGSKAESDAIDKWEISEQKKSATRGVFKLAFDQCLMFYKELETIWADELASDFKRKKQLTSMFRRIVPLGVSVGAIYTLNLRAIRHIIAMRCSPEAEEEIAFAMGLVAKGMIESEPRLMGDFNQVDGYWVPKYKKV